ncbi:MAG: response regulator [Nitrospirota bacterium]
MFKILVVDDDTDILELYRQELEGEGYTVILAESGEVALSVVKEHHPHLVTLDILMPGLDGIETLKKIKEYNPRLPVVICTAYDYMDNFNVWASDEYVVKSSDLTELKDTIKRLLEECY